MQDIATRVATKKSELKSLLAMMDQVEGVEALNLLDEFVKGHEASLFQEIGKLTRQLHDSLSTFRVDGRIVDLAENEIPNAKERLKYVMATTEQAAQKVINAIEHCVPISVGLHEASINLLEKWTKFTRREMDVAEFRLMSQEIEVFLGAATDDSDRLHRSLNEMLMAQDYQDLTGQVLKQVIDLVADVEANLVNLIKITGEKVAVDRKRLMKEQQNTGPRIAGVNDDGRMNGQDDVDDLLSSLGF